MKYVVNFLKKQPLICAVFALVVSLMSILSLNSDSIAGQLVLRLLLSGTCAVFLYMISGEKAVQDYFGSTGYVIKTLSVYWIIAGLLGTLLLVDCIGDPNSLLIQGWPLHLLTTFFFFMGVGLFEELMFRAIINDALIYQFRNVKHIFLISAIVTSFVFGFVHVFESVITGEVNDLATAAQAALKTLSSGIFGLNLLLMYWKTRNIWACAVVHGGYDFLTAYSNAIFQSESTTGTYVSAAHATGSIIAYLVQTVIELIIFIVIWKKVGKTIDFEKIRKEW